MELTRKEKKRFGPRIILIAGSSGVGKDSAKQCLLSFCQERGVLAHNLVRTTTRLMRVSEAEGVDYHYVDTDTFLGMEKDDLFISPHIFHGNLYGLEKEKLRHFLVDDDAFIVGSIGYCSAGVKELFPNSHLFYLRADESEIRERLLRRGDAEAIICSKITWAQEEFKYLERYITHTLDNHAGYLDRVIEKIVKQSGITFPGNLTQAYETELA